MDPRQRGQVAAIVVLALAGLVLAGVDGSWGLAALFAVLGALAAATFPRRARRPSVTVRPDLAAWLDEVSARTGEPVRDLVDRSLSDHRHRTSGRPDA